MYYNIQYVTLYPLPFFLAAQLLLIAAAMGCQAAVGRISCSAAAVTAAAADAAEPGLDNSM